MNFKETIANMHFIITEGSVIERLRRDPATELNPHILHAGFVHHHQGETALAKLYREYLNIGRTYNLPMMIYTATWRANIERLELAGYDKNTDVNGDCFRFASGIREQYGDYAWKVFIGGLIGCKGDAYKPEESLSTKEAMAFHRYQIDALAKSGVDFLIGQTLPAIDEAVGIARTMAKTNVPYVLSFIIGANGCLLDGTPLPEAIARVDKDAKPNPCCYTVNCVHPSIFEAAITAQHLKSDTLTDRLIGLQANTSSKSPGQLESLPFLDSEEPETFARSMMALHRKFGMRLLGGCCGTDNRHIKMIAKHMRETLKLTAN
ncbi:MAG: homocysteine S-methyltransferase family protein [bacterium]|nr:homocysteine S-methyltransferase family protein [bacterium]